MDLIRKSIKQRKNSRVDKKPGRIQAECATKCPIQKKSKNKIFSNMSYFPE